MQFLKNEKKYCIALFLNMRIELLFSLRFIIHLYKYLKTCQIELNLKMKINYAISIYLQEYEV